MATDKRLDQMPNQTDPDKVLGIKGTSIVSTSVSDLFKTGGASLQNVGAWTLTKWSKTDLGGGAVYYLLQDLTVSGFYTAQIAGIVCPLREGGHAAKSQSAMIDAHVSKDWNSIPLSTFLFSTGPLTTPVIVKYNNKDWLAIKQTGGGSILYGFFVSKNVNSLVSPQEITDLSSITEIKTPDGYQ